MPSTSRISIAWNHWNRNYRSWDLQASSHGIFGATSSGSPSHIGATASEITGLASYLITGASAGTTASHGTIGLAGSSLSGTTGPSAEPRVDGSTMSATPGITSAIVEPSLGAKLNNETDRQEEVSKQQ